VIDPASPDAILPTVVVRDAGRATPSNEGFVVRASTGERGGTLALDLTDPNGNDSRVGLIEATGGAGSDVIFLSGANNALVRAGAGNDYVMADGNAELYGGAGDDILIGNIAFGEEGDDMLFASALAVGGVGNDRITMFSLEEGEDAAQGLAFGGDGDDVIIGESAISADGGDGNDAISLRAGGFANGGLGNDTLTGFGDSTLEGGDGNDDIFLLAGGSVDGGDGNDDITTTQYATVRGGTGDDILRMNAGGIYRYSAGDGRDSVLLSSPLTGLAADWGKQNRIEISGFARADVDVLVSSTDVTIIPRDPASRDRLTVTRTLPGDNLELVFSKGDTQQTVSITGSEAVWNAAVKVAPTSL
jgi:Ca2+-binding RTX toxin-like protein